MCIKNCLKINQRQGQRGGNMKKVIIDDVEYLPQQESIKSDIKIVILQRGWVMVGRFIRNGSDCKLENASVIRSWGTTKGLGEIAIGGPTSNTKLDKCGGLVQFDYLTVVAIIDCQTKNWEKYL